MFQREITTADIRHIIETGEVIENRPEDLPFPSRLALGFISGRALPAHCPRRQRAGSHDHRRHRLRAEPYPLAPRLQKAMQQTMKCPICRNGETHPGTATLTLERGPLTMVVRHVPAQVCDNCGEE
jgi:YgiT-type zinc finger domain-containing protein